MLNRRSPRVLLSGATAGLLFAITAAAALSAPPSITNKTADVSPEPEAAIAITVRTCPAGYDLTAEGADYSQDCREPAGDTNFVVMQGDQQGPSASTGTSGDAPQESTVQFTGLTPGRFTITAEAPAEIGGAFIGSCESTVRSFADYPFTPFAVVGMNGTVALELKAGETLACDWYQIAASETDA